MSLGEKSRSQMSIGEKSRSEMSLGEKRRSEVSLGEKSGFVVSPFVSQRPGDLWMMIPAELASASLVVAAFRERRAALCAPSAAFGCELLLLEALTNAVLHGSKGDRDKRVLCVVRPKPGRVLIWVEDEGAGFDWRKWLESVSDPTIPGGRGTEIYQKYANRVRFNRKGNRVALVKRFAEN